MECYIRKKYYCDPAFARIDRSLAKACFLKNPYTISKKYLKQCGHCEIYTYGETPIYTYDKIAKECGLDANDVFLELGAGRGRGLFFIQHQYGCRVIGIERIPQFIKIINRLILKMQLHDISLLCQDMLTDPLPKEASFIYLYGTCLKDTEIMQLTHLLKDCRSGTKIVTISYSLVEYCPDDFQLEKSIPVSFPWGRNRCIFTNKEIVMKKELALRACTECIVHEHPLKREEIDELLNLLSDGWQLFDNQRIEKTYQCKQFLKLLNL